MLAGAGSLVAIVSEWAKEQATQLVLAAAVLAALTKWIIVPAYRLLRAGVAAAEFIQHELKENSGRSLRDYAVRTDARIEYLFEKQGIEMPDHLKSPTDKDPHE